MENRQAILNAKETGAESLELMHVSEEDISLLEELETLKRLELFEFAGDFELLRRVPYLDSVSMIEGCEPEDLELLADVPTLRRLAINHWGPKDLSGIGKITQLVELSLSENEQYENIDFVEKLTNLEVLDLDDGQFSDLAPVSTLSKLRTLNLANCDEVTDLTPIAGLTSLIALDLRSTSATDITPLATLSKLQSLKLDGNLDSIEPILNLTQLKVFELAYCETVSDFGFLSQFHGLTHLALKSTLIQDISPLASLQQLVSLSLEGSPVDNVSALLNSLEFDL